MLLHFAFFGIFFRRFTIFDEFSGFGSQSERFLRSFFDKMWLLDEKIDFAKSRSRLGETLIYKVSLPIFAKFRAPKMDFKSDMEKRCKKMCKKKLRAPNLVLLTVF